MSRLRVDRQLWLALLLLVGAGLLLEYTAIDLWVQDLFYNPTSKTWLVDQQAPLGRLFFYNGPKGLVWVIGLGVLTLALGPARWREKWQLNRRGLWLAVLVLAVTVRPASQNSEPSSVHAVRKYDGAPTALLKKYATQARVLDSVSRPAASRNFWPSWE